MNTITKEEYILEVRRMYPDMPVKDLLVHIDNAPKDDNGNIIRGEDMFDFSGKLIGEKGEIGNISIEQLEQQRSNLLNQVYNINVQIQQLELGQYNFEGKFVYRKRGGYMFVTWQKYEKRNVFDGKEKIMFQGFWFDFCYGPYTDSNYACYSALHEWYIPIEIFKLEIKNNGFYEISKEAFESAWVEFNEGIYENGLSFMNTTIKNYGK